MVVVGMILDDKGKILIDVRGLLAELDIRNES